ncbi:MAG: hypothetical protein JNG89_02740 [Planctomycetaceae bacterium]|nr:hypothetical protein [Planctomycetaceae bacterium]
MGADELQSEYDRLLAEGTRLAGSLRDVAQRATVYHHLFAASGRNHAFPLIAAHGALWSSGWFRFGARLGSLLSWQFGLNAERRTAALSQLSEFADRFRDVNRRVCADTYAGFHFTARYGRHSEAATIVRPETLEALNQMHAAVRSGRPLSDAQRRNIFCVHFINEQATVVGPALEAACAAFDWPLLKAIALRPVIRFSYFAVHERLWFRDFSDREERIARGVAAFDHAARVGWDRVESALDEYHVLPAAFFAAPAEYFASLRGAILEAA